MKFEERGTARIAAVDFQSAEERIVRRKNRAGGENLQANLQGGASHGAIVIFAGFGERDDGDDVADANINHHAEFIEDAGEGGAERDKLQDMAFADELAAAMVSAVAMKLEVGEWAFGACVVGHDGYVTATMVCAIARGDCVRTAAPSIVHGGCAVVPQRRLEQFRWRNRSIFCAGFLFVDSSG
jgi:molybdopterin synthase catalytic subunit